MNNPLVSIIVPIYNVENYLRDCLDSIRKQTYQNLEVFLIDDGSTDQSGLICDEFSNKDPRFKTIHKNNSGISSTRNLGLSLANGDYIGFVDSDDVCEPHMYQSLIETALSNQADLVIGGMYVWYRNSLESRLPPPKIGSITQEEMLKIIFSLPPWKNTSFCGGFLMPRLFSREVLQGLSFDEDKTICEDEHFNCQALLRCKRICVMNQLIYRYRQRSGSMVNRPVWNAYVLRGRLKIAEIYQNQNHLIKYIESSICNVVARLHSQWPNLSENQKNFLRKWVINHYNLAKVHYEQGLIEKKTLSKLWWLKQSRWILETYMKIRSKKTQRQKIDYFL